MIEDRDPLRVGAALAALTRCVFATIALLGRGAVRLSTDRRGKMIGFADGSHARVYRETLIPTAARGCPAVLVVSFRLRWVRGWGHNAFRAESILNTPLFVGFPGFVSKLWLAHDEQGVYRGFYEWNDARLADAYARALWWVLALVCDTTSIHYVVLPDLRRDAVLADPQVLERFGPEPRLQWWRPVRDREPNLVADES